MEEHRHVLSYAVGLLLKPGGLSFLALTKHFKLTYFGLILHVTKSSRAVQV